MSWVAVGVAGASAIAGGIQSHRQKKAADKKKVGKETVSQESTDALAKLRARSKQGFAGRSQVEEKGAASRANVLAETDPRNRNAMLAQAMKSESDESLSLAQKDAEAKDANTSAYIKGVQGIGDKKEAIQRSEIQSAASAKQRLLSASSQNLSNALGAAGGAAALAVNAKTGKPETENPPEEGAGVAKNADVVSGANISPVTQKEFAAMSPEQQAAYKAKHGDQYI